MKSEKAIQNEILLALSQNGCKVFRTNAGELRTKDGRVVKLLPKGFPDIAGFRMSDGKAVFVEVKNERGRLRPEQVVFGNLLQKFPVIYGVARSADEAIQLIKE